MYAIKESGKKYSIFGMPDKLDFSVLGGPTPYHVAIHSKGEEKREDTYNVGFIEGLKEGALSEHIVVFEKGVHGPKGGFIPSLQTSKISKAFDLQTIKSETRHQAINAETTKIEQLGVKAKETRSSEQIAEYEKQIESTRNKVIKLRKGEALDTGKYGL